MNESAPIIEVVPVKHSSERGNRSAQERPSSHRRSSGRASSSTGGRASWSPTSMLGGFVQVAFGLGLIAIGIPMLVLPGPGLLSIGAGALLVNRGFSRLRGRA